MSLWRQLESVAKTRDNHLPVFEIGYHFESGLSKHGEPVLHVHEYSKPGIEHRLRSRKITQKEYEKYKKYFKGVN